MRGPDDMTCRQTGFTLIEVIVTIIVLSIAYTMIATFFGTSFTDSSLPVQRLAQSMELKEAAEQITEYYRQDTSDLDRVKESLDAPPAGFGQNFSVDYNAFIKFASGNDTAISGGDAEELLKVRIRHDSTNETITLLFSEQ